MDFGVFGGSLQTGKTAPVGANGLARGGILHLASRMAGWQVLLYLTESHLAAWQHGIGAILAAWQQDFEAFCGVTERHCGI